MKKFELTEETKRNREGRDLHRIRACADFTTEQGIEIRKGDLGGWIEKEKNLSQDGTAWIFDDVEVYDDAKVYGNAKVYNNVKIYGYAEIYDNAEVYDNAEAYEYAKVCGYAKVYDNAKVCGYAKVYDNAKVCEYAKVYNNAQTYDNAEIYGNVKVGGYAEVVGYAKIGVDTKACNYDKQKKEEVIKEASAIPLIPHHVKVKELKQKVKELEMLIIKYCQFNIEKTNAIICIEQAFKHAENALKEAEVTKQN